MRLSLHQLSSRPVSVTALIGCVLALAYLWEATQLPFGTLDRPGAALWPLVVGVLMLISCIAVLLSDMRGDGSWAGSRLFPRGRDLSRVVGALGGMVMYVLVLPILGSVIAASVLMVAMVPASGAGSVVRSVVTGVLVVVLSYVLFRLLLNVQLPQGMIGA